ncbi:MAG: antibiotic biosynthesis monooxygenase [Desulfobulbaceae bacterium]|jgi:quinol monooxygenase YgiN|nr:antibiotic biosynthesis monooxygenase [Desulfobulbaceae bacterium]
MGQVLIIVARIKAKKNNATLVETELLKLVEPTRKEEGCLQYDLHQDNQCPELFLLYEKWETKDLWLQHRVNEHMVRFRKAIEGAVDDFTVNEMTVFV